MQREKLIRKIGGRRSDALLAGSLQFASGGSPGALLLWDRTRGAIKMCFGMNASNQKLVTVRPDLKSIKDLQPTDRIALPAVKTSPQAISCRLAARRSARTNGRIRSARNARASDSMAHALEERDQLPLDVNALPGARTRQSLGA